MSLTHTVLSAAHSKECLSSLIRKPAVSIATMMDHLDQHEFAESVLRIGIAVLVQVPERSNYLPLLGEVPHSCSNLATTGTIRTSCSRRSTKIRTCTHARSLARSQAPSVPLAPSGPL